MCHVANSAKLEKWLDPSIESSVEPSALRSASRNPKLFFGVRIIFKIYHAMILFNHSLNFLYFNIFSKILRQLQR